MFLSVLLCLIFLISCVNTASAHVDKKTKINHPIKKGQPHYTQHDRDAGVGNQSSLNKDDNTWVPVGFFSAHQAMRKAQKIINKKDPQRHVEEPELNLFSKFLWVWVSHTSKNGKILPTKYDIGVNTYTGKIYDSKTVNNQAYWYWG